MPGFSVQRSGYTRVPELFYAIAQDLIANGFTVLYPGTPLVVPTEGQDYPNFKVTLTATSAVDPFAATQPWRLQLNAAAPQRGDVYVGTPLQILADGSVAKVSETSSGSAGTSGGGSDLFSGMLNTTGNVSTGTTDAPAQNFINRTNRVSPPPTEGNYPMSYRVSIASTGITVFVWEDGSEVFGANFEYFCIQRPVDHVTGSATVPASVHNPMFCAFGMAGKNYRFTVREADVLKPSLPVDATVASEDANAIMNGNKQVAITENNQYVITFPNGLNTARYAYSTEIDLIAYTSADLVAPFSTVQLSVYGEATPRTYKAMSANGPNSTGMRILMLVAGGPMA